MEFLLHQHRTPLSRLLLIVLVAVTAGLLIALVWIDLTWRATMNAVKERDLRIKELQGEIVHLDELLTMSALMAATSGDERWERRYREFEPQLTKVIEEALLIVPQQGVVATAQTDQANSKLVAMENKSFALVHDGKTDEAQAILASPDYAAQKLIYAAGMSALDTALREFIEASDAVMLRSGQRRLVLNLGVIVFVTLGWSIFFRMMLRSENALMASHAQLAHTNADLAESNLQLSNEIETRTEAEAAQKELHQKLLATTRQAGMAEIATGVLHNVGNSLNSVNVAATLSIDWMKNSRVADLTRVTHLLGEHADDLPRFFAEDKRGEVMLPYLVKLADILQNEHKTVIEYLEDLCQKVDHTKHIVKSQQSYAKVCGIEMEFDLAETLDDVLKTLGSNLPQGGIELVREWDEVPTIHNDKHKVMQILANLVTNAIHALLSAKHDHKQLFVRLGMEDERTAFVEIEDTGIGIDQTHLTKIFQYGFTTKQTGHGFGLHHSALVAREMGGELRVHSDGPGRGARFTLELPIAAKVETAEMELVEVV